MSIQTQFNDQLSAVEAGVEGEYQSHGGTPVLFTKGLFKVAVLLMRYLLTKDTQPRVESPNAPARRTR